MGDDELFGYTPPETPRPTPIRPTGDDPENFSLTGIPYNVIYLFEDLTFKVIARGFHRYSADALLHRIRWHYHIDRGITDFKCNNNWTAHLARWFMVNHPEHRGFFQLRKRSEKDENASDE